MENNYRVKSNADNVQRQDGVNYHIWSMQLSDTDKVIEFYVASIHPISWYLLALAIAIAFVIVSYTVYFVIKTVKKKRKQQQEANK